MMLSKLSRYAFFLLCVAFAPACVPKERVDQDAVKEEMADREVKIVNEGEILAAAQTAGRQIAEASQNALAGELAKAFGKGGAPAAIEYCNLKAIPLIDSLSQVYGAKIRRVSFKTRNPNDKPSKIEEEILEAYHYSATQGQEIGDNIQRLNEDEILYSKPIVIQNELCLKCHGAPDKDVTGETLNLVKRLYPHDEALGYSMGNLRGMWSIQLSKKQVVKSM